MLERDVARQIDAYLEAMGLRVFRADPGGYTGRTRPRARGLPDRFGILPNGRMFAIEIKRPGARPRKDQAMQLDVIGHLRHNNALMIVATGVDDVARYINHALIAKCVQEVLT